MEKKHCKWYNDEFCTNGDSPCVADYCPVVEYPELCKCREEDLANEKKLTDEEIIKALECCKQKGGKDTCKYCYTCPASVWDFEDGITECNVDLFQKAINLIHRLQGENANLREELNDERFAVDKWMEENAEQKAEIERLTREKTESAKTAVEVLEQNIELQKQVDDLKEHQVIECYGMLKGCDMVKQAVKDTAKEICEMIDGTCISSKGYLCSIISKRYGVEVE